ncbi:hypothetical protein GYB59_19725 [bacterium]|nr:hypothetical protein [bacterium]
MQERNTPHTGENASVLDTDATSRLFENASVDATAENLGGDEVASVFGVTTHPSL